MPKPIIILLAIICLLGCAVFIYGIGLACIFTLENKPSEVYPSFLASTVTSIAAVLSTNLGGVVGIAIVTPQSTLRDRKAWNPLRLFTDPSPTSVQVVACYIYIVALVAAGVVWAMKSFVETAQIATLIPQLSKTLLGIIVGVMALSLNQNTTPKPEK